MNEQAVIKIVKNNKWMVQVFNGLPIYLLSSGGTSGWKTKAFTGANYSHFLISFQKSRATFFYDERDLAKIGFGYYQRVTNSAELRAWQKKYKADYLAAKHAFDAKNRRPLAELSLSQLTHLAQKAVSNLTMAAGMAHALEGIAFVSEIELKKILEKRGAFSPANFQLLSSPVQLSLLTLAQKRLQKIKLANNSKKNQLIYKFLKDFAWLDNSYIQAKILTKQDILKKISGHKFNDQTNLVATKLAKQRLVKKLKFGPKEKFVIRTISAGLMWQDQRKKNMLTALGQAEPVLLELSRRVNLPINKFKYICPQEITLKNLTDKNFLNDLAGRYPLSGYFLLNGRARVFSGKQARAILRADKPGNNKITELSGAVANKGKVTGKVRLCLTISDIPKVKQGEILVASMTRPEFLPAMQKAAAFVTDEGGVTSHASIVSREMRKPCIIGTKIATQVFKTGDLVEVNANLGWVKKLS